MTTIFNGINVFTFNEWKELPATKEMIGNMDNCDTCGGDGEHECECGDYHDCHACNGTGKVENSRDIYEVLLREEIQKLTAWRNGDPTKKLSNLGIRKPDRCHDIVILKTVGDDLSNVVVTIK